MSVTRLDETAEKRERSTTFPRVEALRPKARAAAPEKIASNVMKAVQFYSPYGYRFWSPYDVYMAYMPGMYYGYGPGYYGGGGGGGYGRAYNNAGYHASVPVRSTASRGSTGIARSGGPGYSGGRASSGMSGGHASSGVSSGRSSRISSGGAVSRGGGSGGPHR